MTEPRDVEERDPKEVMEEQDELMREHEDEQAGRVPQEDEDDRQPGDEPDGAQPGKASAHYPTPAEEDWAERTAHPPSPHIARSSLRA